MSQADVDSFTDELSRPLLHKRAHAFLEILRACQLQELQKHMVHMFIEALRQTHSHQALGTLHRQWCVTANVIDDRQGTGLLLVV